MLVTSRHPEPAEQSWSMSKYEALYHKPSGAVSPRMSNFETPLSTQPEWPGQYSYLPPSDNGLFSQPYDNGSGTNDNKTSQAQSRTTTQPSSGLDVGGVKTEFKSESNPLVSPHSDPLGLRAPKATSPNRERNDSSGEVYAQKAAESVVDESLGSTDTPALSLGSNPISSAVSSAGHAQEGSTVQSGIADSNGIKDLDDDVIDDEDMEADGDMPAPAQTAAERTAQRRKMKRFRLTHQQTRFLMSEFAKQPHPDAAHRERLSREIPGLSPRQVQVWFQNRRAKIKRLTADDRDRMIKMRAVPDDFDNVQALHSPYGAVHGLGPPMASPVDFPPTYADHMMRPLMVDVRRTEQDDHMSPTGLSPAFGNIGFNAGAAMSNPDLLSPLSPSSGSDRYGYSSHLSGPLSAGPHPRSANPFARQGSLDTGVHMQSYQQRSQGIRPLQPLHLRDTMTRTRSDTLQSPLRTSMSWKDGSLDYTTYHGGAGSPPMAGRQPPVFPADQIAANNVSSGGVSAYESGSYSAGTVQSPTHMGYPTFQSSNIPAGAANRSRMRAASASGVPLNLDLRTQFRSSSSMHPSAHSPGPLPNGTNGLSVSTSYGGNYSSAPLTSPIDYSRYRTSGPDYGSMSQMSAPIAPPNDFSHAFQASMSGSNGRASVRDGYGSSSMAMGQGHGSNDRQDEYSHDPLGMHRKRSYHGTSSASIATSQPYGNGA